MNTGALFDILEKILLIIISAAGVAFFESMETALLSTSQEIVLRLKARFPDKSRYFSEWEKHPHHLLAAIVIGTNAFFMASGVLAASLSMALPGASAALTPFAVTALILFFGEIIPKVYSRKNNERVCIAGIKPLSIFAAVIAPLSYALVKISEIGLRITGFHSFKESPFVTAEELRLILSAEAGAPAAMMSSVLAFGEKRIKELMVPRSRIFAVNYDSGIEKIIAQSVSSHFSTVPVYRNNLDNIAGIIYTRDLALAGEVGPLYILDDLMRPAFFVPESAPVNRVLKEFKAGRRHMAIVVDEYGITKGLVTVEDIMEEIVGEIYDEFDISEKTITELPDGWLVKAGESVAAINRELKIGIPESGSYSTIAGWALTLFGKIPSAGEQARWKNLKIEIMESDGKKIFSIKIRK